MEHKQATAAYLLDHCRRYAALGAEDLLKALHQSACGCGHLVRDEEGVLTRLKAELEQLPPTCRGDVEALDGDFCRVHLGVLRQTALRPETLARLFCLSAERPCGGVERLEEQLAVLLKLGAEGALPFSGDDLAARIAAWRQAGFPARSHTEAFRRNYAPAYRVLHRQEARLLPVCAAIDAHLAAHGRLLLALEGGAGGGKSTLGAQLMRIYDGTLFHADDYFLRPAQRTAARLAEVGGNLDRERLEAELLRPWKDGGSVIWQRYDCRSGQLCPREETALKPLTVVEGAYSMHPDLAGYYGLSVFLAVEPEEQARRIRRRNPPEMAARFFAEWIPMERRYFAATNAAGRCDLILPAE